MRRARRMFRRTTWSPLHSLQRRLHPPGGKGSALPGGGVPIDRTLSPSNQTGTHRKAEDPQSIERGGGKEGRIRSALQGGQGVTSENRTPNRIKKFWRQKTWVCAQSSPGDGGMVESQLGPYRPGKHMQSPWGALQRPSPEQGFLFWLPIGQSPLLPEG